MAGPLTNLFAPDDGREDSNAIVSADTLNRDDSGEDDGNQEARSVDDDANDTDTGFSIAASDPGDPSGEWREPQSGADMGDG